MGITAPAPKLHHQATLPRNAWFHRLGLGAVLIASAALRLHGIASDSLWLDEAVSWQQSSLRFWAVLQATAGDNYPPLHNILLHLSILSLGDGELALRLPSAIAGVAAIAGVYWVGSLVRGPSVGLVSAALLGSSGFHVWYSQEARPYALLVLTATLFVGSSLRALETGRRSWHGASAVAAALLLYSHPYGLLLWFSVVMAVLALAMARRNPEARILASWTAGQAIAALLFLPWARFLALRYEHIVTVGFWIAKPNVHRVVSIVESVASGRMMAWILAAGAVIGLAAPARLPESSREGVCASRGRVDPSGVVLLAWLLGPLVLGLTASLLSQPILHQRYVICSLPALLILAAMGYCRLAETWGSWILASLLTAAILNSYSHQPGHRHDYRSAVAAYVERARPGDCVYLYEGYLDAPVLYYLRAPPSCFRRADEAADIRPWELPSTRAWLFLGQIAVKERRAVTDGLREHGWETRTIVDGRGVRLLLSSPLR